MCRVVCLSARKKIGRRKEEERSWNVPGMLQKKGSCGVYNTSGEQFLCGWFCAKVAAFEYRADENHFRHNLLTLNIQMYNNRMRHLALVADIK